MPDDPCQSQRVYETPHGTGVPHAHRDATRDPIPSPETSPTPAQAGRPRAPTCREHRIAGWVFLGFAAFFAISSAVLPTGLMRRVMLSLGVCSAVRGAYHLARAATAAAPATGPTEQH